MLLTLSQQSVPNKQFDEEVAIAQDISRIVESMVFTNPSYLELLLRQFLALQSQVKDLFPDLEKLIEEKIAEAIKYQSASDQVKNIIGSNYHLAVFSIINKAVTPFCLSLPNGEKLKPKIIRFISNSSIAGLFDKASDLGFSERVLDSIQAHKKEILKNITESFGIYNIEAITKTPIANLPDTNLDLHSIIDLITSLAGDPFFQQLIGSVIQESLIPTTGRINNPTIKPLETKCVALAG